MNMKKYVGGNYLSVEDVKAAENKVITLLDTGTEKDGKFDKVVEFKVNLAGMEEAKQFTPFSNSIKVMIEQEGEDSMKWAGKQFKVGITTTKNGLEVIEVIKK